MTVYFGNNINSAKEGPAIRPQQEKLPAHEKIGSIYSQVAQALKAGNSNQIEPLLKDLGIDPSDKEAAAEMCHLLTQLNDDTLQISPLASGIFLLKKKDPTGLTNEYKEIAVFKVGHKRAAMESSARQLAHLLGLNKHVISGMYCSMLDLPMYELVKDEDTTEDLWNGNQKVYQRNKPALTPVLQPLQFNFDDAEELSQHSISEQNNATSCSSNFTRTEDKSASADVTQTAEEVSWDKDESASKKSSSADVTQTAEEISWDKDDSTDLPKKVSSPKEQSKSADETTSFDSDDVTPAKKALLPPNHPIYTEGPAFSTACAVVGIVQPFLFKKSQADIYGFIKMTMAALAMGLRDGKSDGYVGSKLYDIEDNFPIRIDPGYVNGRMATSCALDLPYLDQDPRTKQRITLEQVDELHQLVSQWDLFDIIKKMGKLEIRYQDTVCEKMSVNSSGKDEGNYEVNILEGVNHDINGRLNALVDNPKLRILRQDQLNATNTRLSRIRDFIVKHALEGTTFSAEELVDAVDIAGKIYKDRIEAEANTLPLSLQSTLKLSGPHHITGRISPTMHITKTEVEKKTREALQTGINSFGGFSLSPVDGFMIPPPDVRFVNSPNENGFLPSWDISPIHSPDFGNATLFSASSNDDENNILLSFRES